MMLLSVEIDMKCIGNFKEKNFRNNSELFVNAPP